MVKKLLGDWQVPNYFNGTVENDYILLSLFLLLAGIGGVCAAAITYEFLDWLGLHKAATVTLSAAVVEKYYAPGSTSTGVGVSVNPQGSVSPVFLSNSTGDKYVVAVKLPVDDSNIIRLSVSGKNFDAIKDGDVVLVSYRVSSFSNKRH